MRLKTLTNYTTALLISACLALGATLWWSRQALQLPHQLMDRYLDLSQRFQREVADNILAYLAGGDAVRHQSASQALERLDTEVQQLPEALVLALKPSIDSIRAFSAGDLLAAGKLSGDAQGLLLQAEREMAGSMDQLARYAGQSESAAARTYLPLLQAGSQHLLQLTHSRERYITQGLSAPLEDLQRQLKALHALSNELNALPLLGVLEEVSRNSLAAELGLETASTEPAEDRGIALKRELASLIQRYPAELERTRTLISARQQLQQSTREQISSLQQALAGLQPLVRHEQQRIQHEVSRLQALVIGVLLLVALSIDRLQRRLSQLLEGLVPPLSAWADGRFTEPVTLNTKTRELCEIERSLNHLRAYLSNLVGSIRQHAEQVAESSQHLAELSDGLHAGAARQVSDTAHIRDALGELEDTIQQVASDASQTAVASHEADRAAVLGQQVISQSLNGLHDLVKQVQDSAQSIEQLATETAAIGQVLTVISGVAQQTNLLALNAAIEAARAGEMGRGFAVVAEEVRSLAMRTTSATHEIQQLIDRLQQAAHQSVASMRSQVDRAAATASRAASADGALDAVVSAIRTIASSALRIAEATAQQGAAASDIRGHSQRIHQLGEDNLGRIGACRQQGAQLQTLGSQLHQAVQAFQV